uniref:Reverse transcriptase zinc-binding domain-containing protein n=1 Tax=Ananas comosus var. bracteatus TaxID=296719 RepID=A0A6V7Q8Q2_ANACO|nr:unnamed protein product [Ananas comosus var. bracteatus]
MKMGWLMLSKPSTFWAQITKAKFFSSKSFWSATKSKTAANLWRALFNMKDKLRAGCLWQIADGTSILIKEDSWIPSTPSLSNIRLPENTFKVSDLISTGQWDIVKLHSIFEPFLTSVIIRIKLTMYATEGRDKLI